MPFILTIHNIDTTVPLVWPTKQEDKAIASDPDISDLLGYSSAISEDGTTVVVGAP